MGVNLFNLLHKFHLLTYILRLRLWQLWRQVLLKFSFTNQNLFQDMVASFLRILSNFPSNFPTTNSNIFRIWLPIILFLLAPLDSFSLYFPSSIQHMISGKLSILPNITHIIPLLFIHFTH